MSVGGAGKATGLAALLVVGAVVLAAGGLPALGGHTPIDAVSPSAGDQVEHAVADEGSPEDVDGDPAPEAIDGDSGDDVDRSDSQLDESVAAAAEDAEAGELTRALAGALAVMYGDDIGGQLGESTSEVDADDIDADALDEDDIAADGDTEDAATDDDADAADGDADELDDADADVDDADADVADADADVDDADIDADDAIDTDALEGDSEADALPADVDPEDLPDGVEPEDIDGDLLDDDGELDPEEFSDDTDPSEFDPDERELVESLASEDVEDDDGHAADEDDEGAGLDDPAAEIEGLVDSDTRTAGLIVGALLALLIAVLAYRSEKPFVEFLLAIPTRVVDALLRGVFTVASLFERAISRLREVTSLAELRAVIAAAVQEARQSASESIRALFADAPETTAAAETESVMSEREQIRSAWRTVVELVSVPRYTRQTPAAIKQQAVNSGLPEPPVTTLLGAFRAVEYGERDPTARAEGAVDAATEVKEAAKSMAEDEAEQTDAEDSTTTDTASREESE